jgi:hypothetical protein
MGQFSFGDMGKDVNGKAKRNLRQQITSGRAFDKWVGKRVKVQRGFSGGLTRLV